MSDLEEIFEKTRKQVIKNKWIRLLDIAFLLPDMIELVIKTTVVVATLSILGVI